MVILGNGDKIKRMEGVHIFIQMEKDMKAAGSKTKKKAKAYIDIEMGMLMMETGRMTDAKERVQ